MSLSRSYPPCPDYPPYPDDVLQAASRAAARQLGISVEGLHLPREQGDRSARFAGRTAGGVHVFVKMLATEHADTRRLFQHEIAVTHALSATQSEAFYVPELLGQGHHGDVLWMALEYVEGEPVRLDAETLPHLAKALRAIREVGPEIVVGHDCAADHEPWGMERYRRNIHETAARLEALGYIDGEQRGIVEYFTNLTAPELDDADVHKTTPQPQHGDFAPGNLRLRSGTIVVLDWEHANLDRGWLDVAHYATTSSAWGSQLGRDLARAVVDNWDVEENFFLLAQLERLAGRANDKHCRRGQRDDVTLSRLRELTMELRRFIPQDP